MSGKATGVLLASMIAVLTHHALRAEQITEKMVPSPAGTPVKDGLSRKDVLYHVPIQYPLVARLQHLTGTGILVGQVDIKTGKVTSVRMEKSIGDRILDDAALDAFRQWRFKPGRISKFRVPIRFTLNDPNQALERTPLPRW